MAKIEINDENYNAYQEFLDVKNNTLKISHPIIFPAVMTIGIWTITVGCTGLLTLIIMSIMKLAEVIGMSSVLEALTIMMGIGGYFGTLVFGGIKIFPRVLFKHRLKNFQKKHPNFDMNLSKENVEKELEKYHQLSKAPKNIEEKKEEHLDKHKNDFDRMTTEEKLSFLEKEKEFWEQVRVQEKYQEAGKNMTEQEPIKREGKVYHI